MSTTYKIKSGDTLGAIAAKNNTTVSKILESNKGIKDPNKIYAGGSLSLPSSSGTTIQTSTSTRKEDANTINSYNNIMNKGSATTPVVGANGKIQTTPQPTTPVSSENALGTIDSAYFSGVTNVNDIVTKLNGAVDYETIAKRVETLNADPTYSLNAKAQGEYNNQLTQLEKQRTELDTKFKDFKKNADAEYVSAIEKIESLYDSRRANLENVMTNLRGVREKTGYESDSFRYTPNQMNGLIANDEQLHIMRLTQLDAEEKSLMLDAAKAKNDEDWDALKNSVSMYNTINNQKNDTLKAMLTLAADNNNKMEEDMLIGTGAGATAQKTADSVAESIALELSKLSGTARNDKLQEYSKKYKVDTKVLESSVLNAQKSLKLGGYATGGSKSSSSSSKSSSSKKMTADQDIGDVVLAFKNQMKSKGWAGVNPDQYEEYYNYLLKTYGASAVTKFKKALETEGIEVDY